MNCKPGDLAICVSACPSKAANLGALVRIIALLPEHTKPTWQVEALSWVLKDGKRCPPGTTGRAEDWRLRPLRGDDELIVQKKDESVPA